jgi:DNA-directed RNA polymerase subunit omega
VGPLPSHERLDCLSGPCGRPPPEGTPIAEFDVLRSKVDSTFHLVHLAAKRAREINSYFAHLGQGLTQFVPPLVSVDSNKALSVALEEIAAEKVIAVEASDDTSSDPLAFIEMDESDPIGAPELMLAPEVLSIDPVTDEDDEEVIAADLSSVLEGLDDPA